ncbi:membrane protein [Salmonella enterica subsp. salamae]|nr:membrane protein [Salmonella enterica subsp. salamae]
MGLGFQVSVTGSPVLSWDDIKRISQGGNEPKVEFGQPLPSGITTRTATVKMDFLYLTAYKESSAVYTFPGTSNVMNVVPVNYASRNNGFVLSGFNVRILRNGLGTVDIVPSQVNFGHIYTTYEPSQTRQASFTVIARQVLRPAVGQEFTLPLAITFGKGALTQDTGQTLNLVSLDGPNKGQPNGLRLSIKDNKGKEITFDKQELLGDITITGAITGNVSKIYTAVVTPTPGGSVKTGKFSAAIPVTVTYN